MDSTADKIARAILDDRRAVKIGGAIYVFPLRLGLYWRCGEVWIFTYAESRTLGSTDKIPTTKTSESVAALFEAFENNTR